MIQGAIKPPEVRESVSSTEINLSKCHCPVQQLPHFCSANYQMVQSGHLGCSCGGNCLPPGFCFPPPSRSFAHIPQGSGLPANFQIFPFAAAQNVSLEIDAAQDANGRSVLKPSPPGGSSIAGPFMSPLISAVILLQQKVSQLHSLVQLIAEGGQGNHSFGQQQATVAATVATFISQVALTTARMLQCSKQQQQQQQQQQHQQPLGSCLVPNRPDAHINQIFGMPASFGVDLLQANRYKAHNLGESLCNLLGGSHASSGALTEDNSHLMEKPCDRATTACPGYQHIVAQENAPCSTEVCRTTVVSRTDRDVTVAFGEVGCSHAASKAITNCEDLDSAGGSRDEEDDGEAEHLLPGSYDIVEMDAVEILAEHTHFCDVCSKGFKRDANLRMHMRGHGDEYKTPAALARPDRSHDLPVVKVRRFSCPFVGCKRNKNHRKFLPLKTMLCVKNHYRRSHCPKLLTCSKCQNKKFSVVADLKTHEKHCGCEKWQCSCGTTFSRKDKLLGHIGLFQGHMPAFPCQEMEGSSRGGGTNVALHEEDCSDVCQIADRHEVTLTREVEDGTQFSVGGLDDSVLGVESGLNNGGDLIQETKEVILM